MGPPCEDGCALDRGEPGDCTSCSIMRSYRTAHRPEAPAVPREPLSNADGERLTLAASILDAEADVLMAAGRWGEAHAHRNAADLARALRKLRTLAAPQKITPPTGPTVDGVRSNPC